EAALAAADHALDELEYVAYSTHRHLPPDDCAFRLVIPLSRPVVAGEWGRFRPTAVRLLGLPCFDPGTHDESRFYYRPDRPVGVGHFAEHRPGRVLDVDDVLKQARPSDFFIASPPAARVSPPAEGPVDLGDLRAQVVDVQRRKARSKNDAEREK